MKEVLIIDPGYSIREAFQAYQEENFPGHALYGVNFFEDYGIAPVFQTEDTVYRAGEGLARKIRCEISNAVSVFRNRKRVKAIYIPFTNFGIAVCALKLFFPKIPIICLMHGMKFSGMKRRYYEFFLHSADKLIFINQKAYEKTLKKYPGWGDKMCFQYLMPEQENPVRTTAEIDLISIGKTNRDFATLQKAAARTGAKTLIIAGDENHQRFAEEYIPHIEIKGISVSYRDGRDLYHRSRVNVIPVEEGHGICGLTSLLDSFTMGIPVIVSKTEELGIPVEEWGIGVEVAPGSVEEMEAAIKRMLWDQDFYSKCAERMNQLMTEGFTDRFFARYVCGIIEQEIRKKEKI